MTHTRSLILAAALVALAGCFGENPLQPSEEDVSTSCSALTRLPPGVIWERWAGIRVPLMCQRERPDWGYESRRVAAPPTRFIGRANL